jgi:hypothetical protein
MAASYDLVAVRPKMKKADPSSRTKWTEGPGADGKDPRNSNPAISRLVTVQNMTMSQLGEKLRYIAGGYIHNPVLDKTGLEGGYDFMLSFSAAGIINNGGRGGVLIVGGNAGPVAIGGAGQDPSGGTSLFEAMEKHPGIKLQEAKRSVPFLVIDHVEKERPPGKVWSSSSRRRSRDFHRYHAAFKDVAPTFDASLSLLARPAVAAIYFHRLFRMPIACWIPMEFSGQLSLRSPGMLLGNCVAYCLSLGGRQ